MGKIASGARERSRTWIFEGGAVGALVGGVLGLFAGPPGAVVGSAAGGAAGCAMGQALKNRHESLVRQISNRPRRAWSTGTTGLPVKW